MHISEHFDVVEDHRSGSVVIQVWNSDGDSDNWMVETKKIRQNGDLYIVEEASEESKEDWLYKLGYLLAKYTGKYAECGFCHLNIII